LERHRIESHGGIFRDVVLHVVDPLHVTLPVFAHLGTEGIYAWVEKLTVARADVGVTAEIRNDLLAAADTTVTFAVVDREGRVVAESTERAPLLAGETRKVASRITVNGPRFWEPACPYVYQVRATVAADGSARDVAVTPFGIRAFRFDATTGFWINGRHLKLHGWGHKPTNEWAGLGAAVPDWLTDHTLGLMREAGGNFLRWGHAAGPAAAADAADELGLVTMMPGVDGERDCEGIPWKTRTDAFRDLIVYYRNHPSICIWEGGNYNVSPAHAAELRAIVEKWDPQGGRAFGFRMSTPDMRRHVTLDIGTIGRGRGLPSLPVVEGEYDRTEAPRRLWDKWSPPDFGRLGEHEEKNTYRVDSEGFATNAIKEWWTRFGSDPTHCGGANWIFSDGTHGSRQVTDVARATGEVDAVRLPKEAYWAVQSAWDDEPRVHLIGHWNYPEGTRKAMHAVAQADEVELLVNGRSLGRGTRSLDTLFTWTDVPFEAGEIKVVASRGGAAAHAAGRPGRLAGRWRRHRTDRCRGGGCRWPTLPHGSGADRLRSHGAGHLAWRIQQRPRAEHESAPLRHRMRNQSRRHPRDAAGRGGDGHGPQGGPGPDLAPARVSPGRRRRGAVRSAARPRAGHPATTRGRGRAGARPDDRRPRCPGVGDRPRRRTGRSALFHVRLHG
jgi:beta-galactosidase